MWKDAVGRDAKETEKLLKNKQMQAFGTTRVI